MNPDPFPSSSTPPQEYPLAALAGIACHCGFPTTRFPLHEREDEQLCAQKCSAEEFESCGTPSYFIVYQTQVQGEPAPSRPRGFCAAYVLVIWAGDRAGSLARPRAVLDSRGSAWQDSNEPIPSVHHP